ncbi:hypothetical protein [Lunatimonas lonarensis]|nr:hypothetical protein [Lunatimonas lonarensis]
MKVVLLSVLMIAYHQSFAQSLTSVDHLAIKKINPCVQFELPDSSKWKLIQDIPPERSKKGIVMFKHKPLIDSQNRPVEPIMAIIYEKLNDTLDVVEYSAGLIGTKNFNLTWHLLGGYPDYSNDPQSAIFKGTYERNSIEHTVFIGYIKRDNFGVEIICDRTSEIVPELDNEMTTFIKSFTISHSCPKNSEN